MKSTMRISTRRLAGLALLFAATALADPFSLDWYSIDGGGNMWTTGGSYELSGTIGQADAGVLSGGGYEVSGGFWVDRLVAPPVCRGDLNCDGTYGAGSFRDINPFVLYLSNFAQWQAAYPGCPAENGDINGDGVFPSFADINPFVTLLTGS